MITTNTVVTERGQVSIPAEIRKRMGIEPGQRLYWEIVSPTECRIHAVARTKPVGAKAMLGYAATFRETRTTEEWMAELREGEKE
jgi:AbrB family looped-hinge helix DNA binding protein